MSTSSITPPGGLSRAYDTLGPYRLAGTLGQGGMGVVYLGLDRAGRAVAIKALREHIAADPEARARLAREVTTLERVTHPRVAEVIDADPDGARPYIVTRYVPGPPLDEHIREHGPFRGDALVRFARGLYDALHAIHAAGVVHRDLKPGNVLVVDGDPVVIDFGIAHVADDARLTSTGLVMGTPGYLAPEVLEGAPVTRSTDWWGWAATLAYAATGTPPFGTGRVDAILARVRSGQHDLSSVEPRLRPLLASALATDPWVRPEARTVLEALEQAARGATPHLGIGGSGRTELLPVSAPTPDPTPPTQVVTSPTQPVVSAPRQGPPPMVAPAPGPAYGQAQVQSQSQHQGRHGVDPRVGRPARSGQLAALAGVVAALASGWPLVALAVALIWSVVARTVDRSVTATVLRRYEAGGPRGSDVVVAVLRSPFQLVMAAVSTVGATLVALVVGIAAALTTSLVSHVATGAPVAPSSALPVGVGALVACWCCWWGSGGVSLRRGSRTLIRVVTPGVLARDLVTGALVAMALGLLAWALLRHGVTTWWPLPEDPVQGSTLDWQF